MGGTHDYVPIQLTRAFRNAQQNRLFRSWLDMQEAVMAIEFPIDDCPEIRDIMFTEESLSVVEGKLLSLYESFDAATDEQNIHTMMRYVYYVGETYRRAFEGSWAALPRSGGSEDDNIPVVDFPFRETLYKPTEAIQVALGRHTGNELSYLYPRTRKAYQAWLDEGRPERTYRGTLREDD